MNAPIIVAGIAGAALIFVFVRRRRRHKTPIERVRENVDQALSEAEARSRELRKRASKMKGEAKQRLHERAQELEAKQKELRTRLEQLGEDAKKVLEVVTS